MDIKDLEAQALKLAPQDRAELATKILESLEEAPDTEHESERKRRWIEELDRRKAEFEENPDIGIPADEVFRELRLSLK